MAARRSSANTPLLMRSRSISILQHTMPWKWAVSQRVPAEKTRPGTKGFGGTKGFRRDGFDTMQQNGCALPLCCEKSLWFLEEVPKDTSHSFVALMDYLLEVRTIWCCSAHQQ